MAENKLFHIPPLLSSKIGYLEKLIPLAPENLHAALERLMLVSDYACHHMQVLQELITENPLQKRTREEYFSSLSTLSLEQPLALYNAKLRQMRQKYWLQLLLMEYAQYTDLQHTLEAWSDCADALVMHALSYSQYTLSKRYGMPRDEQGQSVSLYTIAMGKLGGRELNFSSDIDLLFAYDNEGKTDGEEQITNEQYFIKVIQLFIQIMQTMTKEGFVFRVDLRLRPNGESGALALSLSSMETYYQEQGRDWERYAMVKARVIEVSLEKSCSWFDYLITPFVYRRYVDFSVIESLRGMKAMIEKEVQLNPSLNDIKRGPGGIREIEFIIQSIQLIRGGRLPKLQIKNALEALACLKKEKLLPESDELTEAYLYFRSMENILQSIADQQTHALPDSAIKQAQLVLAMGHASWDELVATLHRYQETVSQVFRLMLGQTNAYSNEQRLIHYQLSSLWHGPMEADMAVNLLSSLGFGNASYCYQILHTFRHGARCRRLSQVARLRLDRFIPLLLMELTRYEQTDLLLQQVLLLLEQIVGRSAYLALLIENTATLQEVLFCFSQSSFISSLLIKHPFLLEIFLQQNLDWQPVSLDVLENQLAEQLQSLATMEQKENHLRQFKLTHWLLAARAEVHAHCSALAIGRFLSDVAEAIVKQVVLLSKDELSLRYPELWSDENQLALIAYGTLGSREMNYTSDLDLVFIYTAQFSTEPLMTRWMQKTVYKLTTTTQLGRLFAVDTRLRPSGSAGLLVSPLVAFVEYQQKNAWIWEHQALLKARVLLGSDTIKNVFHTLKRNILHSARDGLALYHEIENMRVKIENNTEPKGIKHGMGGLLNLEFFIQYLVLYARHESLASVTHPLEQLEHMMCLHWLRKEEYSLLKNAYTHYVGLLHQDALGCAVVDKEFFSEKVCQLCQQWYQSHLDIQ